MSFLILITENLFSYDNTFSNGAISQGFVCNCKTNFTGRRCQRQRNECHPNPCQNRGKCVLGAAHAGMYFLLLSESYCNLQKSIISQGFKYL